MEGLHGGGESVSGSQPGSMHSTTTQAKQLPKFFTQKRAYPLPMPNEKVSKPQTDSEKARIARVRDKVNSLRKHMVQSRVSEPIQDLPAYWSEKAHGTPGNIVDQIENRHSFDPKSGRAERPQSVRQSMESLRNSIAEEDMRDAMKSISVSQNLAPKQIIRATIHEVEMAISDHFERAAEIACRRAQAPAFSAYQLLTKAASDFSPGIEDYSVDDFCSFVNDFVKLQSMTITRAQAAALFCKYGYDSEGLMPIEIFCRALFTKPARMLGMEPLLRQDRRGRHGFGPGDDTNFDGKIIYQKCRKGIFPPSSFHPAEATRSTKPPTATMELEYCHGYAGASNLNDNLFYTKDPKEIVYYAAALGVVMNIKTRKQRFFHGHNNDIMCLALHPNKKLVATGQMNRQDLPTGDALEDADNRTLPYVCIWDVETCCEVQKIEHPFEYRAVIAVSFSPSGEILATVSSDNAHSVCLWKWMTDTKSKKIPSTSAYGPAKLIKPLEANPNGFFFASDSQPAPALSNGKLSEHPSGQDLENSRLLGQQGGFGSATPSGRKLRANTVSAQQINNELYANEFGESKTRAGTGSKEVKVGSSSSSGSKGEDTSWHRGDGTYELICGGPLRGMQGAPPQVYGIEFNPFAQNEFVTYGIKHVKFWTYSAEGTLAENGERAGESSRYRKQDGEKISAVQGAFGAGNVTNVLSACYIRDFNGMKLRISNGTAKIINKGSKDQMEEQEGETTMNLRSVMLNSVDSSRSYRGNGRVTDDGKIIRFIRSKGKESKVVQEEYVANLPKSWRDHCQKSILLTGFTNGSIGMWIESRLVKVIRAHHSGPHVSLPDGTMTYGGVRGLKLRADGVTLLTAGADGKVLSWDVSLTCPSEGWMKRIGSKQDVEIKEAVQPKASAGLSTKYAAKGLRAIGLLRPKSAPVRSKSTKTKAAAPQGPPCQAYLRGGLFIGSAKLPDKPDVNKCLKVTSPYSDEAPPMFRSLDCNPESDQYICGTSSCYILEVDETPSTILYGHAGTLYSVASHPLDADIFASAAETSCVFVWNARTRDMEKCTSVGFKCRSIQFSACGSHIAVGGIQGRLKVLRANNLQPLETFKKCNSAIGDIKFSPDNRFMATASNDIVIDIYDTGFRDKDGRIAHYPSINSEWGESVWAAGKYAGGYQHLWRCMGHSATIKSLDFSLPLVGSKVADKQCILQSACAGRELLYWNPKTGKQIIENQRDTMWDTWNSSLGFPVMGIWPDGSDNTFVNTVSRSNSREYVATCDDEGCIRLFNYPCVADDAPYRKFLGHASHVFSVRFSCDDRRLFSAGGVDRCILQFRTHGINKNDLRKPKEAAFCDVEQCAFCGRAPEPKQKPVEWVPLDPKGQFWGPKDGRMSNTRYN